MFTPSLGGEARVAPPPGKRPWRIQSQFYAAFFGGPLTIAWIASRNAARLGMPAEVQRNMLAIGAVVTGLFMMAMAWLVVDPARMASIQSLFSGVRPARIIRLLVPALGLILYVIFAGWQKAADRRYMAFGAGQYDALLKPALIAILICDLIMIAAFLPLAGIAYLLR